MFIRHSSLVHFDIFTSGMLFQIRPGPQTVSEVFLQHFLIPGCIGPQESNNLQKFRK